MKEIKKEDIELLSPAGDMECLIAAVQNGANAVYFGANQFNARANSKNFNIEEIENAINYAKLRNVKTHLTLNILIKNEEFEDALNLVNKVYNLGIDAVIVQDLGLAKRIKEEFPSLELHASTQTTIYNLDGVNAMSKVGFDRMVLARELSIDEIKEICKNTDKEIEVFIHGALCISYSGQCLISSIIGGRSGNRGKCAGSCRLPYELIDKKYGKTEEKGYLLSSKDVCTLDILPQLIQSGVKSFKIEGRMKSPEYVGIVTKIYRKYIDMYFSNNEYVIDENDRTMLLQIFNRGGFSTGYLNGKLGRDMMYTKKPNHIGIPVGKVVGYDKNRGHITVKLTEKISLGDSIAIKDFSCKTSELMVNNENIKVGGKGQVVTIGRLKGDINVNDIVYKTVDESIVQNIKNFSSKENIKRKVKVDIELKKDNPVMLRVEDLHTGIEVKVDSQSIVQPSINNGTTKQRVIEQMDKTGNTVFEIEDITVDMEDGIFVSIGDLNEIRRTALKQLEDKIVNMFKRSSKEKIVLNNSESVKENRCIKEDVSVSVLLNKINAQYDYTKLQGVDKIYIPYRFFYNEKMKKTIIQMCNNYDVYVYMPNITKGGYLKLFEKTLADFDVKGIVVSNLSQLEVIDKIVDKKGIDLIANYTLNIFNAYTIDLLKDSGFSTYTLSPELSKDDILKMGNSIKKEAIVYGRTLLMTSEYCVIGKNEKCGRKCEKGQWILKDRLDYEFPVYTDTTNCNSLIYNSKITSIKHKELNVDSIRIDILDESVEEINKIVEVHKNNERIEGNSYTSGNLNKSI